MAITDSFKDFRPPDKSKYVYYGAPQIMSLFFYDADDANDAILRM